jgi:anti-anti-sigma factor
MEGASGGPSDVVTGLIRVVSEGDGHVLYMSGDVDAPVVARLTDGHDLDRLRIVAVDVGELRYLDSTALALLARWAQQARQDGRPAQLRRRTHRLQRVLEVAGIDPLFDPP